MLSGRHHDKAGDTMEKKTNQISRLISRLRSPLMLIEHQAYHTEAQDLFHCQEWNI